MNLDLKKLKSYLREDRLTIFLFHGVVTFCEWPVRNYTRKHLPQSEFERFCQAFSEWGHPLSLDDVPRIWNSPSEFVPYSFAISFDDGFANNYTVACPLLERFHLPATFYVTTSFLNSYQPSWIDAIEIAIENTKHRVVDIDFLGERIPIRTILEKRRLLDTLRTHIKTSPSINPLEASTKICQSLDVNISSYLDEELDRKLTNREVADISNHRLFNVGGHSHTHRVLSFLSKEDLDYEVSTSIETLNSITGRTMTHYSYPEGQQESYNDEVVLALKRAGIEVCPTAITGTNAIGTDLFSLRRISVT